MKDAIVVASANPHKVAEIHQILDGFELLPRPADVPDVVEDGDTFVDNARLKAAALVEATGRSALADDSGLEVDALGGLPGVRSARYAGEDASDADNVTKLLSALEGVEPDLRAARYRAVLLLRTPDGREVLADGVVEGRIRTERAGTGGFGYDCVFEPIDGDGRTFAEMSSEEKHRISHRGRALRALAARLQADQG
jgi:XTP/dITP diphosphohydrolase